VSANNGFDPTPEYGTNTVTLRGPAGEWPVALSMTNAEALAFRFRVFIFVLLYLLGFLAPWDFRGAHPGTLWLAASTLLARSGWISLAAATVAVTLASLACLVLGTILRVWGTAYLGSRVMRGAAMQGEVFVAAGPYRYVRNPLYLGSWLLALGVSVLMPPGGAAFFLVAFSVFVLLLIRAEERFLSAKQGEAYQQYRRIVPRFWPRLWTRTSGSHASTSATPPRWGQALLAETYPVAISFCFAVLAWRYNARMLVQCVLVCYGVSLVVRALTSEGRTGGA
jgi:protein-S-isoprenylcysteine O-methyltransferase Ste14